MTRRSRAAVVTIEPADEIKLSWSADDVEELMDLTSYDVRTVLNYLARRDVSAEERERLEQADAKRARRRP